MASRRNRSEKNDIAARIDNVEGKIAPAVGVWELNHPDFKTTHTFGDDRKVRPVTRSVATAGGNSISYTFPKHSLTILRLTVN